MKRKRKIQLAAEVLTFIMFISYGGKTLKLVKEIRNDNSQNKGFSTSTVTESEENREPLIITEETMESEAPIELEETTESKPLVESKEPPIPEISSPVLETQIPEVDKEQTSPETMPIEKQQNIAHTTTMVNMRSSNTTDALKINNLQVNEKVYKIFSCENNWDLVRYNGQIGYICRDYLEYSDETVESKYQYTPKKDIALTIKDLNFRPTPSTEVKRIKSFEKDAEVEVIAEVDNGWYLVKSNGTLGYVYGEYITSLLDRANQQYPELELTELQTQKVVCAKSSLNIRNGAGVEYDQIGSLEEFETVRVMKEYGDWYFVMTNDYNFGFINKEYTDELDGKFKIIDTSEQRLWLYNNSVLYYTTPVTTGKDSSPSHLGRTTVNSMEREKYLSGSDYKDQLVKYWIGINDYEEGIHDAFWRFEFGKEVNYHLEGSHGCINTPEEIMPAIFEATSIGDTVIVHK